MFPGINGREWFAGAYRGLRDGGVEAAIRVHDWKGAEIVANLSDYRNRAAADAIAAELAAYRAKHPGSPIDLVGYSGGGGLAIMVAEALPPEVRLRNVVLAQPAVSRDYGLCPALEHVDGRLVNFYCPSDWVILGAGTTVFGTIDRKHVASAGKEGFDLQAAVPDEDMRNLVEQRAWSWDMFWTGHAGGHLGLAMREWNKRYVAPLLLPDTASDIRPRFDYPVLFQKLRADPGHGLLDLGWYFFDMHGNPGEEIEALCRARFGATRLVCRELDELEVADRPDYARALFYVLGRVKDPASIEWLEDRLEGQQARLIQDTWLAMWRDSDLYVWPDSVKWLTGTEPWTEFFIEAADCETNANLRLRWLQGMYTYLHSDRVISFFQSIAEDASAPTEERLLAMTYLYQHGRPPDGDHLTAFVQSCAKSDAPLIIKYVRHLPHEAFVPWLLSLNSVPVHGNGSGYSLDWELRRITFARGVEGQAGWQAWYEKHRGQNRQQWIAEALDEFEGLQARSPDEALRILERECWPWCQPIIHERMLQWAEHKPLHRWLVSYLESAAHPWSMEQLRPIAERIIQDSLEDLDWQSRHKLLRLGFLPGDYWEEQFQWSAM